MAAWAGAALVVTLLVADAPQVAAGGGERTSKLRPPRRINISVKIGEDGVTASPTAFGAGPIEVLASNQSSAAQRLTLDGPPGQAVGRPDPAVGDGQLKVTVQPGAVFALRRRLPAG